MLAGPLRILDHESDRGVRDGFGDADGEGHERVAQRTGGATDGWDSMW